MSKEPPTPFPKEFTLLGVKTENKYIVVETGHIIMMAREKNEAGRRGAMCRRGQRIRVFLISSTRPHISGTYRGRACDTGKKSGEQEPVCSSTAQPLLPLIPLLVEFGSVATSCSLEVRLHFQVNAPDFKPFTGLKQT